MQACGEAAVLMAVAAGRRSDVDKRATSGEHGVESNSLMPSPVLPCSHHRGESTTEEVANAHEAPITAAGQRCSDSAEEEDSLDENDMIRLLDELQEDITYDQDEKEFMDWLQASMTGSDVHSHPSPSPEQRRQREPEELLQGLEVLPASRQGTELRGRARRKALTSVRGRYIALLQSRSPPSPLGEFTFSTASPPPPAASPATASPASTQFCMPVSPPLACARSPTPHSAAPAPPSPPACSPPAPTAQPTSTLLAQPAAMLLCDLETLGGADAAWPRGAGKPQNKRCREEATGDEPGRRKRCGKGRAAVDAGSEETLGARRRSRRGTHGAPRALPAAAASPEGGSACF